MFTFHYPPEQVFAENGIQLITTPQQKETLLLEAGVSQVVSAQFDAAFAGMPPEQFVEELLVKTMQVEFVVCGFNFRFGHKAKGDSTLLHRLGQTHGFQVQIIPPHIVRGQAVSSTRIRQALLQGDVQLAASLLGRYQSYRGPIAKGKQRGRKLGFPTANISIDPNLVLPCDGVYFTWTVLEDGRDFPSVTSISNNPTFEGVERTIETHVISFSGDLYQQSIEVQFLKRLRDTQRFSSEAALRRQIEQDCQIVTQEFQNYRLQGKRIVLN